MTAKQELDNYLRKCWDEHTANLKIVGFGYKNKNYKPQSMGFVCIENGNYYPMITHNNSGIKEKMDTDEDTVEFCEMG